MPQHTHVSFSIRTANACFKDAADLHAELDEFPAAIARYEKVADHSLTSSLTKYSVKEYWLRASLCALAMRVRTIRSLNPGLRFDVDNLGPHHCETQLNPVQHTGRDISKYARSKICGQSD